MWLRLLFRCCLADEIIISQADTIHEHQISGHIIHTGCIRRFTDGGRVWADHRVQQQRQRQREHGVQFRTAWLLRLMSQQWRLYRRPELKPESILQRHEPAASDDAAGDAAASDATSVIFDAALMVQLFETQSG